MKRNILIICAAVFVVVLLTLSLSAEAKKEDQWWGKPFQALWDVIFGLQEQVDALEARVEALEGVCTPETEVCDGVDNDCDGEVDEDFPDLNDVCIVGVGVCMNSGIKVCNAIGDGTECNAVAGEPTETPETTCDDGLDNDCDGLTDGDDSDCAECEYDSDCDDGNVCTTDTCDTGTCIYTNNVNPCDDGDDCTEDDTCSDGMCSGGMSVECDDGNPCTTDSCNPVGGCVFDIDTSLSCDDGDACTEDDACQTDGSCMGVPLSCTVSDPHATGTCISGACIYSCESGYHSCGTSGSGIVCYADDDVLHCGDDSSCTVCEFPNANAACVNGACVMTGCYSGYVNCDANPGNGCETNLDSYSNSCGTAEYVGSHCGDEECGFMCPSSSWQTHATRTGLGSRWFRFYLDECSNCCADIYGRVTLSVPTGADYDLYAYSSCGSLWASSTNSGSTSEQITLYEEDDCLGEDNGFDVWVEVRYYSGASCGTWSLTFEGRNC